MRTRHFLAFAFLVLLFAAPTLSAQALAEKALTTAANPAPTLRLPHVDIPHATVPGTSMHSWKWQPRMAPSALQRSAGNRSEAAKTLNITRQLLYTKLKRYGLDQSGEDETSSSD